MVMEVEQKIDDDELESMAIEVEQQNSYEDDEFKSDDHDSFSSGSEFDDASPLEDLEGRMNIAMSNSVTTEIRGCVKEMAIGKTKTNDKADRATVENAIDPRTRMEIYKMMNKRWFQDSNGCILTRKEANVYHATKSDGRELAIKIYKTSVLAFKDRARYVKGDRRFENEYCGSNPRKMVKTWAEKERSNLSRLKAEGIRCPKPYLLKQHILVMEFIGKDGCAAPRLKDADLSLDRLREGYVEMIVAMRTLYQKCRLVHGDLSEYNILYNEGHLYIIDVSQGVDLDHPLAFEFLIEDCIHVSDFFKKHGVGVMTIVELFVFIFDALIADDAVDSYLEEVQQKLLARGDVSIEDENADRLFAKEYIANKLVDVKTMNGKDILDLYYQTIPGLLVAAAAGPNNLLDDAESQPSEDNGDISDSEEILYSESGSDTQEKKDARKKARKENKKKVKEENKEKRKKKKLRKIERKLSKAPKTR
ncbi:serine/threonine-protein kinase rio1 [Medicago truncatula]|uniref:serine/threonine-protein kinase rio1 n=1 Tax=Medicago truncatula TaxID=3880 RepID=UPI001966DB4C|nr:serine/threonine-protein kinase rio1 [Medicago truncatula]